MCVAGSGGGSYLDVKSRVLFLYGDVVRLHGQRAPMITFASFSPISLPAVGACNMPRAPSLLFALQLGMHVYDKAGDIVRKFAKPAHPETDPDHVVTLCR